MTALIVVALLAVLAVTLAVILGRHRTSARRAATPERPAGKETAARGEGLGARVRALLLSGAPADWAELEEVLIKADVGPKTAARIVGDIRERYAAGADPEKLLLDEVVAILGDEEQLRLPEQGLGVVLVVGVNGSGKTTTIGKLAAHLARKGHRVGLAGSDTFRAAAGEQLSVWAERAGAHLVTQDRGADPSAVAFDAVKSAEARGTDVLIVDTAGRLHTRTPLMDELKKIRRVIEKAGGTITETLLVLDATTGQNGIAQARAFTEAVEVTGVVLTKMDGTARGGIVLAVREELGVPVKLVGTGEGLDDLARFDASTFAERLVRG